MRCELVSLCASMIADIHANIDNMIVKHETNVADIVDVISTEANQKAFLQLLISNKVDVQQDKDVMAEKEYEKEPMFIFMF